MEFCTGCGHRLGVGRFCTNCGRPIAADAPPAPPAAPAAPSAPSGPRYPLYAGDAPAPTAAPRSGPPPLGPPPTAPPHGAPRRPPRSGPSFLAVALTVVTLLLVAAIGGLLMFSGGGDDAEADAPAPVRGTAESAAPPPSATGSSASGEVEAPPPPADAEEVAGLATVTAPVTARPNLDTQGNPVSYRAENLVDGATETCWRRPGDGTGDELVITFPAAAEITEVGLVNGYAKRSGALDWYAGNRRVLAVEWVFDDGTVVPQTLEEDRTLQSLPIDAVTSTEVVLRLVAVSDPGDGPSARDYTAISEISLLGSPAGN